MSSVTNIILIEVGCHNSIDKINKWTKDNSYGEFVELPSSATGGNKELEADVYISGFNYFDLEAFIEFLKTIVESFVGFQVFAQGPDCEKFELINIDYIPENNDELQAISDRDNKKIAEIVKTLNGKLED